MISVVIALIGQTGIPSNVISKDLDPSLRPRIELAPFKKLKCVSVSEYTAPDEKTKKPVRTRVYRFTYKGDYLTEGKRWETVFPKSGGWTVDRTVKDRIIFDREVQHKEVRSQGLILHSGKIEFDKGARAQIKGSKEKGWVLGFLQ